jgi:hypothetical protein
MELAARRGSEVVAATSDNNAREELAAGGLLAMGAELAAGGVDMEQGSTDALRREKEGHDFLRLSSRETERREGASMEEEKGLLAMERGRGGRWSCCWNFWEPWTGSWAAREGRELPALPCGRRSASMEEERGRWGGDGTAA